MSESGHPVQARRGPLAAAGVLATLGVLAIAFIGIVLAGIGCAGDPQSHRLLEYCEEANGAKTGIRATLVPIMPPLLTALAAIVSGRRRQYGALVVVALTMSVVGLFLPLLLWD